MSTNGRSASPRWRRRRRSRSAVGCFAAVLGDFSCNLPMHRLLLGLRRRACTGWPRSARPHPCALHRALGLCACAAAAFGSATGFCLLSVVAKNSRHRLRFFLPKVADPGPRRSTLETPPPCARAYNCILRLCPLLRHWIPHDEGCPDVAWGSRLALTADAVWEPGRAYSSPAARACRRPSRGSNFVLNFVQRLPLSLDYYSDSSRWSSCASVRHPSVGAGALGL